MSLPDWREEPIGRHHDRKGFDCSSPDLNEYLDCYARQNHESGGAKTFVAVAPDGMEAVVRPEPASVLADGQAVDTGSRAREPGDQRPVGRADR